MEHFLPEEELIEYVKPYLKEKGLRKRTNAGQKILANLLFVFIFKVVVMIKRFTIFVLVYLLMI